jgi:hypothetical protein
VIDRAIGIIGIALALFTLALQYYFPQLPAWAPRTGFGAGIFLFGVSVGLIGTGGLRRKRPVRPSASLRLHIFGDHRAPNALSFDNIFRWYYLQSAVISVGTQGNQRLATFGTLFVTFEDDVTVGTLNVRSPDMQLPVYEVKEFNQRYAIITFQDNVPAGTLEVQVHS